MKTFVVQTEKGVYSITVEDPLLLHSEASRLVQFALPLLEKGLWSPERLKEFRERYWATF